MEDVPIAKEAGKANLRGESSAKDNGGEQLSVGRGLEESGINGEPSSIQGAGGETNREDLLSNSANLTHPQQQLLAESEVGGVFSPGVNRDMAASPHQDMSEERACAQNGVTDTLQTRHSACEGGSIQVKSHPATPAQERQPHVGERDILLNAHHARDQPDVLDGDKSDITNHATEPFGEESGRPTEEGPVMRTDTSMTELEGREKDGSVEPGDIASSNSKGSRDSKVEGVLTGVGREGEGRKGTKDLEAEARLSASLPESKSSK